MTPIFGPKANALAKLSLAALAVGIVLVVVVLVVWSRSPYPALVHNTPPQPVQFPHGLHVAKVGVSCEYCHNSAPVSTYAGYPSTHTCMSCHSQVLTQNDYLAPVRQSWATGQPLHWNKVNNLPDYAYFNHSIHVAKGVGCSTCHGNMTQMTVAQQVAPLTMGWCLNCHRDPAPYLRTQEQIYDQNWTPPRNQAVWGARLVKEYHIDVGKLSNCSICHH